MKTQKLSFCSDYTRANKILDQEINDRVRVLYQFADVA